MTIADLPLYVFSSSNLTNVWAGIGAGLWAVSQRDENQMKGSRTKALAMMPGAVGVLYCSEVKALTTPFLVYSSPDTAAVVTDVWPERWVLPFRIHALGTPSRRLPIADAMTTLKTLREDGRSNISHVLPISATTVFSPKHVFPSDWSILIERLAT